MTLEYVWLFLLIILVHLLDLFILLLDSYTIARCVVVITYILTIFCIIMKNSLFLWLLSISNCCCLLFILFYLKLIHSYTSVWFTVIVFNILFHIVIVLPLVYILYYNFIVNFSKTYFFCNTWAFLTLLIDYSCNPTWSIHNLAKFLFNCFALRLYYLYSCYFLYNYEKLTFLWHLSISNCCCLLFILFYLKNLFILILLFDLISFL